MRYSVVIECSVVYVREVLYVDVVWSCRVGVLGECLVCVMYVCRSLYFSEGIFCVLCEFVPVCLPVVSI